MKLRNEPQEHQEKQPVMRPLLLVGDTLIYPGFGPAVVVGMDADLVFLQQLDPSRDGLGDILPVPTNEFCVNINSYRHTFERHQLPIGSRIVFNALGTPALYEVLGSPIEGLDGGDVLLSRVEGLEPAQLSVTMEEIRAESEWVMRRRSA